MSAVGDAGLDAARHVYESAGFKLAAEQRHHCVGEAQVGQTWRLAL